MVKKSRKYQPAKVIIVLPAFNEEARINSLLDRIEEAMGETGTLYHVVIVDDGSTDTTATIAKDRAIDMPLTVKKHPINLGLGATIRDGLFTAVSMASQKDIVVTMDADDTHAPGLIKRMARMIQEGYDVVIASRYQPGSRTLGVPASRRFLSYGSSILLRAIFPTSGVKDYTCGYRAYRASILKTAMATYGDSFVDQDGFQVMVDILLKLRSLNLVFGEVPMVLRYDYKEGGSKMPVGRTALQTLRLVLKRRFKGWENDVTQI